MVSGEALPRISHDQAFSTAMSIFEGHKPGTKRFFGHKMCQFQRRVAQVRSKAPMQESGCSSASRRNDVQNRCWILLTLLQSDFSAALDRPRSRPPDMIISIISIISIARGEEFQQPREALDPSVIETGRILNRMIAAWIEEYPERFSLGTNRTCPLKTLRTRDALVLSTDLQQGRCSNSIRMRYG